jgi:hypothetical protein
MPKNRLSRMTAKQAAINAVMSIKESKPNGRENLTMFVDDLFVLME